MSARTSSWRFEMGSIPNTAIDRRTRNAAIQHHSSHFGRILQNPQPIGNVGQGGVSKTINFRNKLLVVDAHVAVKAGVGLAPPPRRDRPSPRASLRPTSHRPRLRGPLWQAAAWVPPGRIAGLSGGRRPLRRHAIPPFVYSAGNGFEKSPMIAYDPTEARKLTMMPVGVQQPLIARLRRRAARSKTPAAPRAAPEAAGAGPADSRHSRRRSKGGTVLMHWLACATIAVATALTGCQPPTATIAVANTVGTRSLNIPSVLQAMLLPRQHYPAIKPASPPLSVWRAISLAAFEQATARPARPARLPPMSVEQVVTRLPSRCSRQVRWAE